MAKLTKAQIRAVETAIYHLNRAQTFLDSPETILARTGFGDRKATCTLDFTLPDGRVATEIAKDIGSDMAGLPMAREYLINFLKFHS